MSFIIYQIYDMWIFKMIILNILSSLPVIFVNPFISIHYCKQITPKFPIMTTYCFFDRFEKLIASPTTVLWMLFRVSRVKIELNNWNARHARIGWNSWLGFRKANLTIKHSYSIYHSGRVSAVELVCSKCASHLQTHEWRSCQCNCFVEQELD